MAAGWSVLGNCYTTPQQVVNAFSANSQTYVQGVGFYLYTSNISFNPANSRLDFSVYMQGDSLMSTTFRTLQACNTDYTPTPANTVITGGNGTGTLQPPLTSVTPNTKISSMGQEDVILICAVLFACLFGFSTGVTTGKGIAK